MAVTVAKLNKLDKANAKSIDGESLWVTIVLEDSTELQGYFRHDGAEGKVAVKVPGRRGRLKFYPLSEVNDIEESTPPASVAAQHEVIKKVVRPSRQGTTDVTSVKDNGTQQAVGAAAKKLASPAGVLCYITGKPTDATRDVCLLFEGTKYFITREAFSPVLEALGLLPEAQEEAPAEAPVKRRPGRPAGSKTVTRRAARR